MRRQRQKLPLSSSKHPSPPPPPPSPPPPSTNNSNHVQNNNINASSLPSTSSSALTATTTTTTSPPTPLSPMPLSDLYAQDTVLGYQSKKETRNWWMRMPTYRKRNLTKKLNTKRITRAILFELRKIDGIDHLSLNFPQVESIIINKLISNKDFMAGVSSLFIATIGAPIQPEWHETAALFLKMNIQQRSERFGKASVMAECSHQLIHRSGYIDLNLGNDFLCVADLFVICAVREMEHKLTYNYLFSIWSIGSMLLFFLGLTYSILSMHRLHPIFRLLCLILIIALFAATRRKNRRKANASYLILSIWMLYIAWNASMFSMLKFFTSLLIIFPELTLDFRLRISNLIIVNSSSSSNNDSISFVNLRLLYLREQIQYFSIMHMLKTVLVWIMFFLARLSQQLKYPGLLPAKYESFILLLPLLFPNLNNLSFGIGLGYFLQSFLNSISFIYVFIRECFQCCCCFTGVAIRYE